MHNRKNIGVGVMCGVGRCDFKKLVMSTDMVDVNECLMHLCLLQKH